MSFSPKLWTKGDFSMVWKLEPAWVNSSTLHFLFVIRLPMKLHLWSWLHKTGSKGWLQKMEAKERVCLKFKS